MKPYAIIDLHCDTLTNCEYENSKNPDTLNDSQRILSIDEIPKDVHWAQFYAVFVPDEYSGEDAVNFFEENRKNFERQMKKFSEKIAPCRSCADMERAWEAGKTAAFLSVENGNVLCGDTARVEVIAKQGVRALTLVWNGKNEIASGISFDGGISSFGREVIPELEKQGIIIDISHLNDQGFEDLLKIVRKPFAATHSNSRSICRHKRNLTDEMIVEMVKRDCLIGLNYYITFLRDDAKEVTLDDLYRHVYHFLELGADKNLALGSDFDGADIPECINTPKKAADFYGYLISRGITPKQADMIFYENARRFIKNNL